MENRRTFLRGLASAPVAAVLPGATAGADRIPALHAEKIRLIDLINDGQHASDAAANALMDAWGECDRQAIASPATTVAGALASIEWAREELLEFGFEVSPAPDDGGVRIILALIDGAIGVLRRNGGAT